MDRAHDITDERIAEMEKDIDAIYSKRAQGLERDLVAYLEKHKEADEEQRRRVDAKEITMTEYRSWRVAHILNTKECQRLIQKLAKEYVKINAEALEYVNGTLASTYMLNANTLGRDIERQVQKWTETK